MVLAQEPLQITVSYLDLSCFRIFRKLYLIESVGDPGCTLPECLNHPVTVPTQCTEVTEGPRGKGGNNCAWTSSTDLMLDQKLLGGKIVAYKIQWFNGIWSPWYVPGYNDMDWKFNNINTQSTCQDIVTQPYSLRRVWSYFQDHTHTYIICKW